jgi:uncharacterized membrane protein YbhN (UPF0104 family)
MVEAAPDSGQRRFLRDFLRIAVAFGGVVLIVLVVRREGPDRIAAAVARARPVLLPAFLLEVGRMVMETFASRASLGERGKMVPWRRMFMAQLVAHAMLNVAPAPRASAEVTKAALLSRWVGGAESAAAGAVMQAATFVGVAFMSALCGAVILLNMGPAGSAGAATSRLLGTLLLCNAALLFTLGVGLRALLRSRRAVRWAEKRFPTRAEVIERFRGAASTGDLLAFRPALFLALGMCCQVMQMKVLSGGVGAPGTVAGAFAAQGVHLVMASLAVFVPGQLGAREAAFGLAARAMGTTSAVATSIALLAHASQIVLAIGGFAVLFAWRHSSDAARPVTAPAASVKPADG